MLIGELDRGSLALRLRTEGIHLDTGAFTTLLRITLPHLVDEFAEMYAHYQFEDPPTIDDADVLISAPSLLRRYVGAQAQVWVDGIRMFAPVPAERAYTALETALNWGVASSEVAPLLLHSAVVERDGRALLLPAATGSGKSTLCAALSLRGWRLLSDEMVVLGLEDGLVRPNPRPVSLKNRAIGIIAAFSPHARMTTTYRGTHKGDVAYMQAPAASVARAHETVAPALVISPAYVDGAKTSLTPLEKAAGMRLLIDNAVNYASMLDTGFGIFSNIAERCAIYSLTYSSLDQAIETIDRVYQDSSPLARSA